MTAKLPATLESGPLLITHAMSTNRPCTFRQPLRGFEVPQQPREGLLIRVGLFPLGGSRRYGGSVSSFAPKREWFPQQRRQKGLFDFCINLSAALIKYP